MTGNAAGPRDFVAVLLSTVVTIVGAVNVLGAHARTVDVIAIVAGSFGAGAAVAATVMRYRHGAARR